MTRGHERVLVAAVVLALTGCVGARKATRLEGHYSLGKPGDGWSIVKPGGADHAWLHEGLSATIYADSNCGARYDDRPLDKLAESLVYGVASSDPLRTEALTVDGRDAVLRVVDGRLDGVGLRVAVAVLKKDLCVYDLLYLAPPTTFDAGWASFEQVLDGFATRND